MPRHVTFGSPSSGVGASPSARNSTPRRRTVAHDSEGPSSPKGAWGTNGVSPGTVALDFTSQLSPQKSPRLSVRAPRLEKGGNTPSSKPSFCGLFGIPLTLFFALVALGCASYVGWVMMKPTPSPSPSTPTSTVPTLGAHTTLTLQAQSTFVATLQQSTFSDAQRATYLAAVSTASGLPLASINITSVVVEGAGAAGRRLQRQLGGGDSTQLLITTTLTSSQTVTVEGMVSAGDVLKSPAASFAGSLLMSSLASAANLVTGQINTNPEGFAPGVSLASASVPTPPTLSSSTTTISVGTSSTTPSASQSPSASPSTTPTPSPSLSSTASATSTPSNSPTASNTGSGTGSGTGTPTPSPTGSGTRTTSDTPTTTPTSTLSHSPTTTTTLTTTPTPSWQQQQQEETGVSTSPTTSPTTTTSISASGTGSTTGTPTPTPSSSPTSTGTGSGSGTATGSGSGTGSGTLTPSNSPTPTPSFSPTPSTTSTLSSSPTPTVSGTATESGSGTATPTPSSSSTPTPSATSGADAAANEETSTPSPSSTPTPSPSATTTPTGTDTATPSPSPTTSPSSTPSATPSASESPSPSSTPSPTGFPMDPLDTVPEGGFNDYSDSPSSSSTPSIAPSPSPACDIYVSDKGLPGVFKLPKGQVSSMVSIPGTWASPSGVFVDGASKNVYVADGTSVKVIHGGWESDIDNAPTTHTSFIGIQGGWGYVQDVFVDTRGVTWVVDSGASGVFQVSEEGVITPFTISIPWVQPRSIHVTAWGDVYVSDFGGSFVVNVTGWGAGMESFVGHGIVSQPAGLWVSSITNELYVTEFNNMALYTFPLDGSGGVSQMYIPMSDRPVDVGGSPWGGVFVAEQNSAGIYQAGGGSNGEVSLGGLWSNIGGMWMDCAPVPSPSPTPSATPSPSVSASPSSSPTPSPTPTSSASASDTPTPSIIPSPSPACDIYVSDKGLPGVFKLPKGQVSSMVSIPGTWASPSGVFVDGTSKSVYVADGSSVKVIHGGWESDIDNAPTTHTSFIGIQGGWGYVEDVFVDTRGVTWVVDSGASGVFQVSEEGVITPFTISIPWVQPRSVHVTAWGDVYVSDFGGSFVVNVTGWGAGLESFVGHGIVSQPAGLWVSSITNELYVTEFNNMALYTFPLDGSGGVSQMYIPMSDRPVDVGGSPWGGVFVAEQNSAGIYQAGGGSNGEMSLGGLWSNIGGMWMDCAPVPSPSPTPSATPSPSVSASPSSSPTPSPTPTSSASASNTPTPSIIPSPSPACDIYVSDKGLPGVFKLPKGQVSSMVSIPGTWASPSGVFVDGASKSVFVADGSSVKMIHGGWESDIDNALTTHTSFIGIQGGWGYVEDVFVDTRGVTWVVDSGASGVFQVSEEGVITPFTISIPWVQPRSVHVTAWGDVYVSDFGGSFVVNVTGWGAGMESFVGHGIVSQPAGLWVSSITNELFVTEFNNMALYTFPLDGSGGVSQMYIPMSDRPVDVGGSPWGGVFVAEQNSAGIYQAGGGSNGEVSLGGLWSNIGGMWMDCAPVPSPSPTPSATPSPSVSASPSSSPTPSPSITSAAHSAENEWNSTDVVLPHSDDSYVPPYSGDGSLSSSSTQTPTPTPTMASEEVVNSNDEGSQQPALSASPSATPTPTSSPSLSSSPSSTPTPTPTPTSTTPLNSNDEGESPPSPSASVSSSMTPSTTPPAIDANSGDSEAASESPSTSFSSSPTPSITPSSSPSNTPSPSTSVSNTPSPSTSFSSSPTPSITPSSSPSNTPSPSTSISNTPSPSTTEEGV